VRAKRNHVLGLFLAGVTIRFFTSEIGEPNRTEDHPGYRGWYWRAKGSRPWVGAYKTQYECVEQAEAFARRGHC
jgi:hypothetical protein